MSVGRGPVDHGLELSIFAAGRVAADRRDLMQEVFGLEAVALLGVPHAVIGPGARMPRVGGERLFVPDLGVAIAAKLAAGIADIVGNVRMLVVAERAERDCRGLVLVALDQAIGVTVALAEIPLALLLAFRLLVLLVALGLVALFRALRLGRLLLVGLLVVGLLFFTGLRHRRRRL